MLRVAYDGSWFDNQDDTLVWDSPLRLDDSTSAPGRGRMALWPPELGANRERRRLHEARAAHAAHRLPLLSACWSNDEPLQPFTINPPLPADRAAAGHHRRPGQRVLDQPEPRVAPVDGLAVQRAGAPLRLRQPDAARRHPRVHQLRHVGEGVVDRRAGAVRAQPHELRRRRDLDRPAARSPSRAGYSHNASSYDFRIFESIGRGRPAAHGGRDGLAVAHVPGPVRVCRQAAGSA